MEGGMKHLSCDLASTSATSY